MKFTYSLDLNQQIYKVTEIILDPISLKQVIKWLHLFKYYAVK